MNWTNEATRTVNMYLSDIESHAEQMREFVAVDRAAVDYEADICEYVELNMIDASDLASDLLKPVLESVNWEQIAQYWIDRR